MNIRTKTSIVALAAIVALFGFATASTVSAATTTASSTAAKAARLSAQVAKAIANADKEISRRIDALNQLSTRIGGIKKVSDAGKAAIVSTVSTEIADLTALKAKIDADTDATVLKTDVKSITGSYRIFALVIPQGHLLAAVDSVNATADSLATLGGKLSMRIASSSAAGKDVTALNASLTDLNAKIADARSQATAAWAEVASLKPDNGDKATMTANTAALKDARAKIKAASEDLKAARKDAQSIVDGLRAGKAKINASTTPSTDR